MANIDLHASCRLDIVIKLRQAKLRQQSKSDKETCHHDLDFESPAPKHLRSSTGTVHDKNLHET